MGGKRVMHNIKEVGKEQQMKSKVSRKKEIIKIRAEINEIEKSKIIKKSQ